MKDIFVCYRRSDSADATGRIYDQLKTRFGDDHLFTDVDSIPLGSDFRRVITEAVGHCSVLIVVIGPRWLDETDETGRRRIDDANDFVRIEIAAALERDIPVVPVLVGNTTMPAADALPDAVSDLAFRHGTPVRPDPDFHTDVQRLCEQLADHVEDAGAERDVPRGGVKLYVSSRRSRILTGAVVGVVGGACAVFAEAAIYADDERMQMPGMTPGLLATLVGGGLVAAAIWMVAGLIAGPRVFPLLSALVTSLLVVAVWIGVFGTYEDVMGAAAILGWPVGGVGGAAIAREVLKIRGRD